MLSYFQKNYYDGKINQRVWFILPYVVLTDKRGDNFLKLYVFGNGNHFRKFKNTNHIIDYLYKIWDYDINNNNIIIRDELLSKEIIEVINDTNIFSYYNSKKLWEYHRGVFYNRQQLKYSGYFRKSAICFNLSVENSIKIKLMIPATCRWEAF